MITTKTLGDLLRKVYSDIIVKKGVDLENGWGLISYERNSTAYGKHIKYTFSHCSFSVIKTLPEGFKVINLSCRRCSNSLNLEDWQLFAYMLALK